MDITQKDHETIRAAIIKAEKKTSAEIFAVLARQSSDYSYVAIFFLSLWIFLFSFVLALWLQWKNIHVDLVLFTGAQLAAFLASFLLLRLWPDLQLPLTPTKFKHRAAHKNAVNQFLAHGIHNTKDRTGILIFVSHNERFAEILVDEAIEKQIGREHWFDEVATLIQHCKSGDIVDGYEITIGSASKTLAEHFPRGRKKLNELEDKLVII